MDNFFFYLYESEAQAQKAEFENLRKLGLNDCEIYKQLVDRDNRLFYFG